MSVKFISPHLCVLIRYSRSKKYVLNCEHYVYIIENTCLKIVILLVKLIAVRN